MMRNLHTIKIHQKFSSKTNLLTPVSERVFKRRLESIVDYEVLIEPNIEDEINVYFDEQDLIEDLSKPLCLLHNSNKYKGKYL